jgi:hypothetical protein
VKEVKTSLERLGGQGTVSQLVDQGAINWRNAKRKSVMRRIRRALKLLAEAGYVSSTTRGAGITLWQADGLSSLSLPHSV